MARPRGGGEALPAHFADLLGPGPRSVRDVDGGHHDLAIYFVRERGETWPDVTVGRSRRWAVSIDRLAVLVGRRVR